MHICLNDTKMCEPVDRRKCAVSEEKNWYVCIRIYYMHICQNDTNMWLLVYRRICAVSDGKNYCLDQIWKWSVQKGSNHVSGVYSFAGAPFFMFWTLIHSSLHGLNLSKHRRPKNSRPSMFTPYIQKWVLLCCSWIGFYTLLYAGLCFIRLPNRSSLGTEQCCGAHKLSCSLFCFSWCKKPPRAPCTLPIKILQKA